MKVTLKDRRKSENLAREHIKDRHKRIEKLEGKERLEYEISSLKRNIQSCDNDLAGNFLNNNTVIEKKKIYEKLLKEKEKELLNINKGTEK